MRMLTALASGLLFGAGLALSGMINPAKVLGFLDIAGDWDPSLAFVMMGAIPIAALGFSPLLRGISAADPQLPANRLVDLRLVGGAILFGIGWGLAGFCPGPALASLGFLRAPSFVFVAAMLVGIAAFRFLDPLLGCLMRGNGAARGTSPVTRPGQ